MENDRDWIDRNMAFRQIKHEFSPYDENALENYIMKCTQERTPIDLYAETLWEVIEALCYLPNKEEIEKSSNPCSNCQEFICDGCIFLENKK